MVLHPSLASVRHLHRRRRLYGAEVQELHGPLYRPHVSRLEDGNRYNIFTGNGEKRMGKDGEKAVNLIQRLTRGFLWLAYYCFARHLPRNYVKYSFGSKKIRAVICKFP